MAKPTRRRFLQVAAAAFSYVPAAALGRDGQVPASERIGLGHIGIGRRGGQLMRGPSGSVSIAVADVYEKRFERVKGSKIACYKDYRRLLERKDIDAVTVGTPDHWHTACSLHAAEAGKDVYCEKPLTLTIREGRMLVEAVRRYGRVFQTGSQQRSSAACRVGCQLVRSGRAGKIHTVHGHCYPSPWECDLGAQPVPPGLDWDMWLGQTSYRPYNRDIYLPRARPGWISFRPWSGGEMTGWGAHGLDIIQWGLGMDGSGPVEVWADSRDIRSPVHFRYASGVVVHLDQRGVHGGGIFVGTEGKITVDRGYYRCDPPEIGREPIKPSEVHLYYSNNHMENWGQCIRTRKMPICDVEIGHRSCTVCHLGNIARWCAPRRLRWDPEKEEFIGDEEANRYVSRAMRAPYCI